MLRFPAMQSSFRPHKLGNCPHNGDAVFFLRRLHLHAVFETWLFRLRKFCQKLIASTEELSARRSHS